MTGASAQIYPASWRALSWALAGCRSQKGRTVLESLLGSGDWLATFMDHGKQSATIHNVISPDGKTMTQTAKFVDAHGQTLTQIQVFRRQ